MWGEQNCGWSLWPFTNRRAFAVLEAGKKMIPVILAIILLQLNVHVYYARKNKKKFCDSNF